MHMRSCLASIVFPVLWIAFSHEPLVQHRAVHWTVHVFIVTPMPLVINVIHSPSHYPISSHHYCHGANLVIVKCLSVIIMFISAVNDLSGDGRNTQAAISMIALLLHKGRVMHMPYP